MIENKQIPSEVINIRQAWIRAINRVAEAIAYRYKRDVFDQYSKQSGIQTVVESIMALYCLLVDYGEAPVKTEVDNWYDKHREEIKKSSGFDRMTWYREWFEYMVKTLNKYGMLFESQPKGYSNVEMKSD